MFLHVFVFIFKVETNALVGITNIHTPASLIFILQPSQYPLSYIFDYSLDPQINYNISFIYPNFVTICTSKKEIQQMNIKLVEARVRKETRYDSLIKLVVLVIKELNLYKKYKVLAQFYNMKYQRNYSIIFFGICLIQYALMSKGWLRQNILEYVFGQIEQNLDSVLKERYSNSQHAQQLIKLTKLKNLQDINVIKNLFSMEEYDEDIVEEELNCLYKTRYNLPKRKENNNFNDNIFSILKYFRYSNNTESSSKIEKVVSHIKDATTEQQIQQIDIKEQFRGVTIKQQYMQDRIEIKKIQENQFRININSAFQIWRGENTLSETHLRKQGSCSNHILYDGIDN